MVVEEQAEEAPGQHLAAAVAVCSSFLLIYLGKGIHIVAKSHLCAAAAEIGAHFGHPV